MALGADVDHVRLAGLLRRAHTIAIDTGVAPRIVRQIVSDSWRRSAEAGVDPGRPAPRLLDTRRTTERLRIHPFATVLPQVSELLKEPMVESGYFAAFSDADGILLWTDGPARALRSAVTPRFLPGFVCREDRIGTNAIGTALVLDHPVQIFSAEHFNELLHGWTCAAAPVHDPDNGELLGAIDLSGEFRTAHVHGLALAAAVAKAAEGWLAAERRRSEGRLQTRYHEQCDDQRRRFTGLVTSSGRVLLSNPPGWLGATVAVTPGSERWALPDGSTIQAQPLDDGYVVWRGRRWRARTGGPRMTVAVLGWDRARVCVEGKRFELRPRHSEIVVLLALNPGGMTVRDLALELYGAPERQATVRAEVARLRQLLGNSLCSRPYRLDDAVQLDLAIVQRHLTQGNLSAARRRYTGALLPGSGAPAIVTARDLLAAAIHHRRPHTPLRRTT